MSKVFVGNLAYSTSWQNLKDHFRQCGEVAHAVVLTSGSRSKGCGLVEFTNPQDATRAIETLHDTMLDGRKIQVREDREQNKEFNGNNAGGVPRGRRAGGAPRVRPARNFDGEVRPPSNKLFVSNLSWSTNKEGLTAAFGAINGLVNADIEYTWNGRAKGSGIVEFETIDQARAAIEALDKTDLQGRTIYVQFDKFIAEKADGGDANGNDTTAAPAF